MIEVTNLTKRYGDHVAIDNLSFRVEKGQIYGFLGPNGAGKSTTMNIMTGCLSPTDGIVRIDGHDIFEEPQKAKKLMGYLPEQPPLYMNETPVEYLKFVGAAKGLKGMELAQQVEEVIGQTKIGSVRNRLISALSKGYKQRVGIAQALLGNPEVIILDEPTVGLDPIQIIEIRDLIRQLGESHTVILSSHILSEVQAICQKVLIIAKGRLVAFDAPENLEKLMLASNGIDFTVEALSEEAEEILEKLGGYEEYTIDEVEMGLLKIHVKADTDDIRSVCRQLFFAFAEKQKAIVEMVSKKVNLEDVFIELTEGDVSDGLAVIDESDADDEMDDGSLYGAMDISDKVDAEDALKESEVEKV